MLVCPLCGGELFLEGKSYKCKNRHCFDLARQGYVNLLPVQNKHSLHPGDTKEMLEARRRFLESGKYLPLCKAIKETAKTYCKNKEPVIVDVGCGEGYYTRALSDSFEGSKTIGIDIAKDGVKMACSRGRDITWAVATASLLPLADKSADIVTAVFSLFMDGEYSRILKEGGIAIEVNAATEHLIEMKRIIYDDVFPQNKKPSSHDDSVFKRLYSEKHSFRFQVDHEQLKDLLYMTPHLNRIKEENKSRLLAMDGMELTAAFWISADMRI